MNGMELENFEEIDRTDHKMKRRLAIMPNKKGVLLARMIVDGVHPEISDSIIWNEMHAPQRVLDEVRWCVIYSHDKSDYLCVLFEDKHYIPTRPMSMLFSKISGKNWEYADSYCNLGKKCLRPIFINGKPLAVSLSGERVWEIFHPGTPHCNDILERDNSEPTIVSGARGYQKIGPEFQEAILEMIASDNKYSWNPLPKMVGISLPTRYQKIEMKLTETGNIYLTRLND